MTDKKDEIEYTITTSNSTYDTYTVGYDYFQQYAAEQKIKQLELDKKIQEFEPTTQKILAAIKDEVFSSYVPYFFMGGYDTTKTQKLYDVGKIIDDILKVEGFNKKVEDIIND
jgi:hypothetical protein